MVWGSAQYNRTPVFRVTFFRFKTIDSQAGFKSSLPIGPAWESIGGCRGCVIHSVVVVQHVYGKHVGPVKAAGNIKVEHYAYA